MSSSIPEIVETEGEWAYEEGCLSLPGLAFEIVRPKLVTVRGIDRDGNELTIQGANCWAGVSARDRSLDGVLMLDRLDRAERKVAMRELREQGMGVRTPAVARTPLTWDCLSRDTVDAVPRCMRGRRRARRRLVITQPDRRRSGVRAPIRRR
jgi:hypothetical protein